LCHSTARNIEKLLGVFNQFANCLSVEEIVRMLLDEMKNLVSIINCTIFLLTGEMRDQLELRSAATANFVF
jgi:hypothetical protein